jgi:hypothetical protein
MKTRIRTISFIKPKYYYGYIGEEFIIQEKRILFLWFVTEVHPVLVGKKPQK